MNTIVEICAGSLESCIAARDGGAQRVELCSALSLGGITPSYGVIALAKEKTDLDINVLIRPRGGDFLYTREEMEVMKKDIETCAKLKVNGVVFGALDKYGNVDLEFCRPLALLAKSLELSFTFHRAIDRSSNILKSVEDVISLGAQIILTSGGAVTAFEGLSTIKEMAKIASGRITIMPGSGINSSNIMEIAQAVATNSSNLANNLNSSSISFSNKLFAQVHLSASQEITSNRKNIDSNTNKLNLIDREFVKRETSKQKVREAIDALSNYNL